jgi:hypothetical protein
MQQSAGMQLYRYRDSTNASICDRQTCRNGSSSYTCTSVLRTSIPTSTVSTYRPVVWLLDSLSSAADCTEYLCTSVQNVQPGCTPYFYRIRSTTYRLSEHHGKTTPPRPNPPPPWPTNQPLPLSSKTVFHK